MIDLVDGKGGQARLDEPGLETCAGDLGDLRRWCVVAFTAEACPDNGNLHGEPRAMAFRVILAARPAKVMAVLFAAKSPRPWLGGVPEPMVLELIYETYPTAGVAGSKPFCTRD